ncbi:hypothetical protein [Streptomyces eurythermus]
MAGKCGCGSGSGAALRLDPAACNALTRTASGLLVPRTVLTGIAPGGAVSTTRSVDVDVTETPGCPDAWAVGARLTPFSGQTTGVVSLDASPANTWVPVTGAQLVLPEPGVYEVTADVQCSIGWSAGVSNAIIDAQIFNVTVGAAVPLSARRVILFTDQGAAALTGIQANASATALYQVAGPATLRVEASWRTDVGSTSQKVLWAQNFRFKKVAD